MWNSAGQTSEPLSAVIENTSSMLQLIDLDFSGILWNKMSINIEYLICIFCMRYLIHTSLLILDKLKSVNVWSKIKLGEIDWVWKRLQILPK